jgi:predicted transcriptional regulator
MVKGPLNCYNFQGADFPGNVMNEVVKAGNRRGVVNVQLDARTNTALGDIAGKLGTSKAELLSRAAAEFVSYLRWKEKAIAAGFASGSRKGWLSTEDVRRDFARRRAAHAGKREKAA